MPVHDNGMPACWQWKLPTAAELAAHDPGSHQRWFQQLNWHRERCAVCGLTGGESRSDHDHHTGLYRGQLCGSCNIQEANCGWPADEDGDVDPISDAFARYRLINPARIWGIVTHWERPQLWQQPAITARQDPNPWRPEPVPDGYFEDLARRAALVFPA